MKHIPHKWRTLSKEVRLNIPSNYFDISEEEIKRIRSISDSKKRLIESAKLQYELFKEIHTDLTAWIAGYSSDSVVRKKLGSTQKLRDIFIKPLLNNNSFKPSWQDRRRNITLPDDMSESLAEESGIHIGDGNLYATKYDNAWCYKYDINGNLENEYNYHKEHISKLMKQLYNCPGYITIRKNRNGIESVYKSKIVFEYKRDVLKFPVGSKLNIEIPRQILKHEDFIKRCLCGIFDTDFHLGNYMILSGKMSSLRLLEQICKLLSQLNINYKYKPNRRYGEIRINSSDSISILEDWKLNNEKHLSKYFVWKETKKYFPHTTTTERLTFINNKLDISYLDKISKKEKKPR